VRIEGEILDQKIGFLGKKFEKRKRLRESGRIGGIYICLALVVKHFEFTILLNHSELIS
jgi:hypothetical protein